MDDFYLGYLVPAAVLFPLGVFSRRLQYAPQHLRVVFYYLLISAGVNATATAMAASGIRNLPLLHLYTTIEGALFFWYFYIVFRTPAFKRAAFSMLVLFPVASILNFAFVQSPYEFNTYTRPLEALLITACCLLFALESNNRDDENTPWAAGPENWINTGLLVYFPAAFVIFTFSNRLLSGGDTVMFNRIWVLHGTLVLLMYIFFGIGFLKCRR